MKERKAASNRIDMTGKIYNSWKILNINIEASKGKIAYWDAICLECNTAHVVHGPNVRNGLSLRCVACGHVKGHSKQKGQVRTAKTSNEMAYKYLYIQLKRSATSRTISWALNEQDTTHIVKQNCHYCNRPPGLACNPLKNHGLSQKNEDGANILRNGIDRIDSSKGYEAENVVPCCADCNRAKLSRSAEEFITHSMLIADYQRSKIK